MLLSIDIGLDNLALIAYNKIIQRVIYCDKIDIRSMTLECPFDSCPLHHKKTFSDYVDHLIYYNKSIFENAEKILIEQQPPNSFGQIIEQLIFSKYRNKCVYPLMSPTSMHCHFEIQDYEYNERKEKTVEIAEKYLCNFDVFSKSERKHDLADAMCYILHYLYKEKINEINEKINLQIKENNKKYLDSEKNKEKEILSRNNFKQFIYNDTN
jgi:hypothetical protein